MYPSFHHIEYCHDETVFGQVFIREWFPTVAYMDIGIFSIASKLFENLFPLLGLFPDEKYGLAVDNESAYEILTEQNEKEEAEELRVKEEAAAAKQKAKEDAAAAKKKEKEEAAEKKKKEKRAEKIMSKTVGRAASSAFGTIGREIGKSILRGLFGNSK